MALAETLPRAATRTRHDVCSRPGPDGPHGRGAGPAPAIHETPASQRPPARRRAGGTRDAGRPPRPPARAPCAARGLAVNGRRDGFVALLRALGRQWCVERRVRRRGSSVRTNDAGAVCSAYEQLTAEEFEAINGPQQWANWRFLPRVLDGLLPGVPATVLDLGCGAGGSTEVLAFCAAPGSHLLGYDVSRRRIQAARRRRYRHGDGSRAHATFRCQAIFAPLCDAAGRELPEDSVDLAHASGVVGHHLDAHGLRLLAAELRRVVRPGRAVVLDAGPRLDRRTLAAILGEHGFDRVGERGYLPFNPRAQLSFRRRAAAAGPAC